MSELTKLILQLADRTKTEQGMQELMEKLETMSEAEVKKLLEILTEFEQGMKSE